MNVGEFSGLLSLQVVLSGLAAWLGKVWAERIASGEQAKLDERLRCIEASLEAVTHVTKAQFETEFEIYRELWDRMLTATGMFLCVPAVRDSALPEQADHRPKQLELLNKAVGDFGATLQRNRPFYAEEVYRATEPISRFATEAWIKYQLGISKEEYGHWVRGVIGQVIALQDQVREAIRSRMRKISTISADVGQR